MMGVYHGRIHIRFNSCCTAYHWINGYIRGSYKRDWRKALQRKERLCLCRSILKDSDWLEASRRKKEINSLEMLLSVSISFLFLKIKSVGSCTVPTRTNKLAGRSFFNLLASLFVTTRRLELQQDKKTISFKRSLHLFYILRFISLRFLFRTINIVAWYNFTHFNLFIIAIIMHFRVI